MTRYKPYKAKITERMPGQVQKRAILLTDQEREAVAKLRFIDLFGLDSWEECSSIKTHAQFQDYCRKNHIWVSDFSS